MKRSLYLKHIIPCGLVMLICLVIIVLSAEIQGFTDTQRFRLAEKAQVIGPSKILGTEQCADPWGQVMIGQTAHGYTLFQNDTGELRYCKKMPDFTTVCPTKLPHDFEDYATVLPVLAFTEDTRASSARLTATVYDLASGALMEFPFIAEVQRSENGYFLFDLPLGDYNSSLFQDVLCEMLNDHRFSWVLVYGTTTLELYDDNGNLLQTFTRDYYVPESE